jgi:hypothetical protein
MDLEEYVNILYKTEQATDVNRWIAGGVHAWPFFRAQTITMFRNPDAYFSATENEKPAKSSLKDKLFARYYAWKFLGEFSSELRKLPAGGCDVLFYSKASSHTDKIDGKTYDRFTDPLFEQLHEKYKVQKLELTDNPDAPEPRAIPSHRLNHRAFKDYVHYRRKFEKEERLQDQPFFNEVLSATGIPFSPRHMSAVFAQALYYRDLFRKVLSVLRPKYIFLKGYYENDSAGLILAAKELGIKTIDIQHGKQGAIHPMYTHWTSLPENGYWSLPDFFWNWGTDSAQNIRRWMNRRQLHEPVVGGNAWMSKWKHGDIYKAASKDEADFTASLKEYSRVISFALQPLDKDAIIPPHLAEAIRRSPGDWAWLIRRHPLQKVSEEDIWKLVQKTNAFVEMQFASSLPLYELLKLSDCHLTLWS